MWQQKDFIQAEKNSDKRIEMEKIAFKKRIFVFWDFIISIYNKGRSFTEQDKGVISELAKLSVYLSEIDKKSFKRLLFSAPYVTFDFDSPFFIEYLNNLKDFGNKKVVAEYVATLFITMLRGSSEDQTPDYDWGNIDSILKYLYKVDTKKVTNIANDICIFYAKRGNLRLREIYEENNNVF
jgi:hypothetical protein